MDFVLEEVGEYNFPWVRTYDQYVAPRKYAGYLSGQFPLSGTTVDGAPVIADVRVLFRPAFGEAGDGSLVEQVTTSPDGSWRVNGLNPALKFDVVGRRNGFNDVIMANVSPAVE